MVASTRILLPLLTGLAGVAAGALLFSSPTTDASSSAPELAALRERLEALERREADREPREPAPPVLLPPERGSGREDPRAAAAVLARRVELLEKELELERLRQDWNARKGARAVPPRSDPDEVRDLSTRELVQRARTVGQDRHGRPHHDLAVPYWREALARSDLEDELRFEALDGLGQGLRKRKLHDEEAEVYRRLADLAGPRSRRGAQALYDLSWTHWYRKDIESAFRVMCECTRAEGTQYSNRRVAHFHAADWAMKLRHYDEARTLAEELARLCAGRESGPHAHYAEHAASILERLDAR